MPGLKIIHIHVSEMGPRSHQSLNSEGNGRTFKNKSYTNVFIIITVSETHTNTQQPY